MVGRGPCRGKELRTDELKWCSRNVGVGPCSLCLPGMESEVFEVMRDNITMTWIAPPLWAPPWRRQRLSGQYGLPEKLRVVSDPRRPGHSKMSSFHTNPRGGHKKGSVWGCMYVNPQVHVGVVHVSTLSASVAPGLEGKHSNLGMGKARVAESSFACALHSKSKALSRLSLLWGWVWLYKAHTTTSAPVVL